MGLFRRPSLSRMLGISAAKAKLSRQLGFSITQAAKGKFVLTKPPRAPRAARASTGTARNYRPARSAIVIGEPNDPGAVVVQVSARTLRFPDCCACCQGPPDEHLCASFSRPNGEVKKWMVPHCMACFQFNSLLPLVVEAREDVEMARAEATEYVRQVHGEVITILGELCRRRDQLQASKPPTMTAVLVALIGGGVLVALPGLWLNLGWVFVALASTWLMAMPIILCWPQVLSWLEERQAAKVEANAADLRREEVEAAKAIAESKEEARLMVEDAVERYGGLEAKLRAAHRPGRLAAGRIAVEYLGWSGTIHTFAFGDPSYAALFCAANREKVL